jgi:hypothetical protein
MGLPTNSPTPIQLPFPLHDLPPTLPDPPLEELILPRLLWTTLTPLQRQQLRQRLIALLQEVLHASDRC